MNELLDRLYREHRRGLFLMALSITRSAADAEDAVHDAFARMCRREAQAPADLAAYIFSAVRNAALDRMRRKRPDEEPGLSLASCLDGAEMTVDIRERNSAIASAADELPENLRMVVFLRIYGGLTFREIGEMTETPLQTVVSRYDAALERLRPLLRKWL